MALSKDAQAFLDNFEVWDPDGTNSKDVWARISSAEREEINVIFRERMHAKNAGHLVDRIRDLPKKWRDAVIERFKDLP